MSFKRVCQLFTLFFIVLGCSCDFTPPEPSVFWFEQRFDHFNPTDKSTFKEKVLIYDKYFEKNPRADAPLFIICGGEAGVRGGYDHDGLVFEIAREVNGLVFSPEHRFYGESLPKGKKDSFTRENLKRLTVEQALADYIAVLHYVKAKYNLGPRAPIIAVGGSYPGELASYMRQMEVVDGALASSAPVRYRPGLKGGTPNGAFFQTTTETFAMHDASCPARVRSAFNEILRDAQTEAGRRHVSEKLGLCTPFDSFDLVQLWVESAFATLAMENYPYAIKPFPAWPMDVACQRMVAAKDDYVYGLRHAIGLVYNISGDVKCHDIEKEYLYCSDITGCGEGTDGIAWNYQFCTQVLCNADTNNVTDMFPPRPFSLQKLGDYCEKEFGVRPKPLDLADKFPPSKGSKIIYPNGSIDGWFLGGILHSRPEDEIISINVTLGAHHYDLRGQNSGDTHWVHEARAMERNVVMRWIKEKQHPL